MEFDDNERSKSKSLIHHFTPYICSLSLWTADAKIPDNTGSRHDKFPVPLTTPRSVWPVFPGHGPWLPVSIHSLRRYTVWRLQRKDRE